MWALRWQGLVDFLVVSAAVYLLLIWGQQARALRIAFGIVCLRAAALLAQQMDLVLTAWVLDAASIIAFILLLVIFQPELRHALLQLDFGLRRRRTSIDPSMPALVSVCDAAFCVSSVRPRCSAGDGRPRSGRFVGQWRRATRGAVSREILEAIFRKVSPVHDGATIIEDGRISRVGVILPLTESENIPAHYGTRHRAALGLAERCDAAVIVVSEERGTVTLVHDHHHTQQNHVEDLVHSLGSLSLAPRNAAKKVRRNFLLKGAALAFAALIWFISFGVTGATVRNISVPNEFTNVPGGLHISRQSASALQVQLRGTSWLFEAVSLTKMAARVDLRGAKEGNLTVAFRPESISPPPGIRVERVHPDSVNLVLSRH